MASTAEIHSCTGYELVNDIHRLHHTRQIIQGTTGYRGRIVGNGFRFITPIPRSDPTGDEGGIIHTLHYDGTIEGVGVRDVAHNNGNSSKTGGMIARLEGKVIGSYVRGGFSRADNSGGIAGDVTTHTTDGFGLIAHSFVLDHNMTDVGTDNKGGLAGTWEHQRGTSPVYNSTCLNSYFSGAIQTFNTGRVGLIGGTSQSQDARVINCVGNQDRANEQAFSNFTISAVRQTQAHMIAVTDYDTPASNNPFANWDDYPVDGSITQLAAGAPRTDVWHFGDETNLPVLKAWGHDWTLPLDRSKTGTDTVNLCSRTLAVANEIIRHLNDSVVLDSVSPTPTALSLQPCTSNSDTRNVTITNLTNLVVTSPTHTFNLNPNRTFPASEKLALSRTSRCR